MKITSAFSVLAIVLLFKEARAARRGAVGHDDDEEQQEGVPTINKERDLGMRRMDMSKVKSEAMSTKGMSTKGKGKGQGMNMNMRGPKSCSLPTCNEQCKFLEKLASTDPDYLPNLTPPPPLEEAVIIPGQPNCERTCDPISDQYFIDLAGVKTSESFKPNTVSLVDVVGENGLDKIAESFGSIYQAPENVRSCIMTPDLHINDKRSYLYYASLMLATSVFQFAPQTTCDKSLGSKGLWYDEDKGEIQSICNPDSPGKQFNAFALNGSLTELYDKCGYEFCDDYWGDLSSGCPACESILQAAPCQHCSSTSGKNCDACYCVLKEAQGIHCPIFGPIYWVNMKIVWQLGGNDYLGNMPGERVFCSTQETTANDCRDMCETKSLKLNMFPGCRRRYLKAEGREIEWDLYHSDKDEEMDYPEDEFAESEIDTGMVEIWD